MCHGEDGRGRVGASLASFPGIDAEAALEQVIAQGIDGSVMPAWGEEYGGPLSDQDIGDISAYLTAVLGGTQPVMPAPIYQVTEIPSLPDVEGDPSNGQLVFQADCIVCHGEQAQGGFGRPLAKAWPGNQPEFYLRQVVSEGIDGTLMPGWGPIQGGPLTDEKIADVTAYILSLSPVSLQPTPPSEVEGPLDRNTSLILLGVLGALVIIILVAYYRKA